MRNAHRHLGFSLTELTVVLLIMAIVAGAVTMKMYSPLARAKLGDIVGQIRQFDAQTREYARQQDCSVRLVLDVNNGEIRRENRQGEELGTALVLPERFSIRRVWLAGDALFAGSASIGISRSGLSKTYALSLEDSTGQKRWILLAGLTGQAVELESDAQIQDIFDAFNGRDAG